MSLYARRSLRDVRFRTARWSSYFQFLILGTSLVLSFFEVPEEKAVEVVAVIGQQHQALAA